MGRVRAAAGVANGPSRPLDRADDPERRGYSCCADTLEAFRLDYPTPGVGVLRDEYNVDIAELAARHLQIGIAHRDPGAAFKEIVAPRPQAEVPSFKLLSCAAAIRQPADYGDLIEDLMPANEVGCLFGAWGGYKTFVAIYLVASWAMGREVLGRRSFDSRRVCYVAAENETSVRLRLAAFCQRHNAEDCGVDVIPVPVQLMNLEHRNALTEQLRGKGYGLIVIDTLSKASAGADDSSKAEMSMLIASCEHLCRELRVTVLGVGHTGHNNQDRLRGSSDLPAGFAFMYRVEKLNNPGEERRAKLTVYKSKDDGEPSFYLRGVAQDTGWRKRHADRDKASLVFEYDPDGTVKALIAGAREESREKLKDNRIVADALLKVCSIDGRSVSDDGCSLTELET